MKAGTRGSVRSLPRRRKTSLVTRVRPFWILWIVVAGLLIWGGVWLAQSPWFRVTQIAIDVPAGSPVSTGDVRTAAAVPSGANLWLLDTGAIAGRIEAIPYVDHATIARAQFPRPELDLTISVRRPAACVVSAGDAVTIDATVRVLQTGCATPNLTAIDGAGASLPPPGKTITGAAISSLVADAKALAGANLAIRQLGRDRWGGLVAVDATGVTIEFGSDADLARKAALVRPVRNGVESKRPIRAIDLRAPGTPTVEFR